jgi:hypothetical protein
MNFRLKGSHRAFVLIALLPCPKFINVDKNIRGVLDRRLKHLCLDIICKPLKDAACYGRMMSDPAGNSRFCFTPLVAYIADSPEAAMLAGVGGKTSHITMAYDKTFGDALPQEPRTISTTLAQLAAADSQVDPWDLQAYVKLVKTNFRLNGVHLPFWRDWHLVTPGNLPEPCQFLTPESLHHWHKMFWDHDAKWCIHMLGGPEINFRFSLIQPIIGFRHFSAGISELKQVTGREHRAVERYIVGIISGAVLEFYYCYSSSNLFQVQRRTAL